MVTISLRYVKAIAKDSQRQCCFEAFMVGAKSEVGMNVLDYKGQVKDHIDEDEYCADKSNPFEMEIHASSTCM